MRRVTIYEVTNTLGNGGARVKACKTLEEARSFISSERRDLCIFKSVYNVNGNTKLRLKSERVG